MSNNSNFSVLEMAQDYASANNTDVKDLFKHSSENSDVEKKDEQEKELQKEPTGKIKKPWVPDASLMEGMSEFAGPVTYSKEELKNDSDGDLKNITDETAVQDSREAMDEMSRKLANIEDAKKRHGIIHFQIPPGQYHATIMAAAGDTNYKRAQAALDEIFEEIKNIHPEFILKWDDTGVSESVAETHGIEASSTPDSTDTVENFKKKEVEKAIASATTVSEEDLEGFDSKVIIDKSSLPQVSWTPEDMEKIKKSRSVELNIVETTDLEYSTIEDVDDNWVDAVLAPYQRKVNDVVGALPASKYRATFTGLTYTEVIDLSNSNEMNNIDGERKKWSIAFNHIKNQSIGPWEEYRWYIDPNTKKKVRIDKNGPIPDGIDAMTVHTVSKFEDFLMKTSFMDLEFILWKILCATSNEQEIIQIECKAINNGHVCGKSYDWIYSPSGLLRTDSINPAVLEEMKTTAEVSGIDEIMKNYNSSMLRLNNIVKLSTSGISVVFGHISAYDYLENVYGKIKSVEDEEDYNDPTLASRGLAYTTLTCIKAFLVPKDDNGHYIRIKGADNIVKVINTLDEIDWQTLGELVRIMMEPYQFKFALRDIVCPACSNRSSIPIDNMTKLLFIVARSLSSVNVVLKRI